VGRCFRSFIIPFTACGNAHRSKDGVDIPHFGQNPNHFNAVHNWQVENQTITNRETSQSGHKLFSAHAKAWKLSKRLTSFLDLIKEPVRIVWIVLGYLPPDFIKVGLRLGTLKDLRHQGVTLFCSAASLLRPRALIAAISKGVVGPLSNPSRISALNSSRRMAW
jgi:hypothetical protein